MSAALETAEQARGNLYAFHQLSGSADMKLQDALEALREAGHDAVASRITRDVLGRNVIAGRWTFQIVKDPDWPRSSTCAATAAGERGFGP